MGTNLKDPYFRYGVTDWANRYMGAKLGTHGLINLAKSVDMELTLSPYEDWQAIREAGVNMPCVLPDMGHGADGQPVPPFLPNIGNPADYERAYAAVDTALDRAGAYKIPSIIAFTGMDDGRPRADQFKSIVKAYTEVKPGKSQSLLEKAKRLGVQIVFEMLNTEGNPITWQGHPGYLGNSTPELVHDLLQPMNSDAAGLAFDVYHVEMMHEDPVTMIGHFSRWIKYVHVAGVMVNPDATPHPHTRCELTHKGQFTDYPLVMGELRAVLPKGTRVLLEYIPSTAILEDIQFDLVASMKLCES